MNEKVDNAVNTLDEASKTEAGRAALAGVADRLAALFGGRAFQAVKVVETRAICPTEPEQTEFDVLLSATGDKKIDVIKVVREVTGLGLKEAKDFVEKLSERCVKSGVDKVTALIIKGKLEMAGATAVLR